jgi:hypothetical protein
MQVKTAGILWDTRGTSTHGTGGMTAGLPGNAGQRYGVKPGVAGQDGTLFMVLRGYILNASLFFLYGMHAAPLPPRYLSRKKEKKKRVLIKFIL